MKNFPQLLVTGCITFLIILIIPIDGWSNGGYSNDPSDPDYGTHDWIVENALDLLPENEKDFIHLTDLLYGTELPDNPEGYEDQYDHHVYYYANETLQDDAAAVRAEEEYDRALDALMRNDTKNASLFIGAMSHYISDLAVFGHVMGSGTDWGKETHHSDFENHVRDLTTEKYSLAFSKYLQDDGGLRNISAYNASLEMAFDTTFDVDGELDCVWMDTDPPPDNYRPTITTATANPYRLGPSETSSIIIEAEDLDDDTLTYEYTPNGGSISGTGPQVTWTAPSSIGSYQISIRVYDGELFSDTEVLNLIVETEPPPLHLLINEFEPNPAGTDEGNEWVELFNPTSSTITLDNWKLRVPDTHDDDQLLSGSISGGGYRVFTFTEQWLDNSDEKVSLIDPDGTEIDSTPTKDDGDNNGNTWQRYPNGIDTNSTGDWKFRSGTKGASNGGTRQPTRDYGWEDTLFIDRVGESMNLAVNLIAEVIHTLVWESGHVTYEEPEPNWPPTCDIIYSPNGKNDTISFRFICEAEDNDGEIVSCHWDFGDGTTSNDMDVNKTYSEAGTFTVNLTVVDDDGAMGYDEQVVFIEQRINLPPVATISANITSGYAPLSVKFISNATDPDGDGISYLWTFEGDSTSILEQTEHIFNEPGNYTVTLTVTDEGGLQFTCSMDIMVLQPSEPEDNTSKPQDNTTGNMTDDNEKKEENSYTFCCFSFIMISILVIISIALIISIVIFKVRKKT